MTSSLLEPECWAPREELEYVEGKRAIHIAFLSIIFFCHLYFCAIQSVHNFSGMISTTTVSDIIIIVKSWFFFKTPTLFKTKENQILQASLAASDSGISCAFWNFEPVSKSAAAALYSER